jgi:hypothetical protein
MHGIIGEQHAVKKPADLKHEKGVMEVVLHGLDETEFFGFVHVVSGGEINIVNVQKAGHYQQESQGDQGCP